MEPIKIKTRKSRADLPIIAVAVGAAAIVMALVALFLVVLPNRSLNMTLKTRQMQLEGELERWQEVIKNLPQYREELAEIAREGLKWEDELKFNEDGLKAKLTHNFTNKDFFVANFNIGAPKAGEDAWWRAYPVDIRMTGKQNKVADAFKKWRVDVPMNARLIEVELRKLQAEDSAREGDNLEVHAVFAVQSVIPKSELPPPEPNIKPSDLEMPKGLFFETPTIKNLRAIVKKLETRVASNANLASEFSELRHGRDRLLALSTRRATYIASHEREFDLLERQMPQLLKKLSDPGNQKVILKIQDAMIEEVKANANADQAKP